MLDTDNDDCIDKSAWLPDGEPILTPERQLKGDMHIERRDDGEINYARASATNILNFLWRRAVQAMGVSRVQPRLHTGASRLFG